MTKTLVALAVLATALVVAGVPGAEIVAGLALALVLPGLALVRALFAGRTLSRVEQVVLVPALSLAVIVIGGLLIFVTGIALTAASWGVVAGAVTVAAALAPGVSARIAARRHDGRFKESGRTSDSSGVVTGSAGAPRVSRSARVRWVAPVLACVLLLGAAGWISLSSAHRQERATAVTELSMLQTGKGLDRAVSVDLTTHNAPDDTYRLVVRGSANFSQTFRPDVRSDGEWSRDVALPIGGRVTADLYRGTDSAPYRTVFVDVI